MTSIGSLLIDTPPHHRIDLNIQIKQADRVRLDGDGGNGSGGSRREPEGAGGSRKEPEGAGRSRKKPEGAGGILVRGIDYILELISGEAIEYT